MAPLGSAPIPWLKPLSWIYGLGAGAKNLCFDRGICRPRRLPVPVVSVGNLSAGGTGKTPMVVWLLGCYRAMGLRVGVLARGYGRAEGEALNDEGRLLQDRFPDLAQRQSPRRHAAGEKLLSEQSLDLILLDDGFQHRKLHRDLDLCLLDASDPFDGGLLPSGWLREAPASLGRADVIVATGSEALDAAARADWTSRLPACAKGRPLFFADVLPRDLLALPSGEVRPLETLKGTKVTLLAGIARPERFAATLDSLGAEILDRVWLADHGRIDRKFLSSRSQEAEREGAVLVMTEKDEARCGYGPGEGPGRLVLRIDLHFDQEPPMDLLLPPDVQGR